VRTSPLDTAQETPRLWHRVTAFALAVSAAAWGVLVWNAPADAVQGGIQKVLYLHVPCALATYVGFGLTAFGGGMYLWKREERWDRFAASAAEVGVLFGTLVLLTGPIWAKGTWGRWWSWDLRLAMTVILYLVYVAYILLRSFTEGSERAARFSAVYAIIGLVLIPLNYFAIDMAAGRSIHPENLGGDSLGSGMGMPFLVGMVTALLAVAFLLVRRLEVAELRAEEAEQEARLALGEAR
jgi:heme exporter protein C